MTSGTYVKPMFQNIDGTYVPRHKKFAENGPDNQNIHVLVAFRRCLLRNANVMIANMEQYMVSSISAIFSIEKLIKYYTIDGGSPILSQCDHFETLRPF